MYSGPKTTISSVWRVNILKSGILARYRGAVPNGKKQESWCRGVSLEIALYSARNAPLRRTDRATQNLSLPARQPRTRGDLIKQRRRRLTALPPLLLRSGTTPSASAPPSRWPLLSLFSAQIQGLQRDVLEALEREAVEKDTQRTGYAIHWCGSAGLVISLMKIFVRLNHCSL
jgi:hypothetical protein